MAERAREIAGIRFVKALDLHAHPCGDRDCEASFVRLKEALTRHRILFGEDSGEIDLVLLRCPLSAAAEALASIRKRNQFQCIIGMFCGAADRADQVLGCLHNGFDDFVCCPVQAADAVPRILSHLRRPGPQDAGDGRTVREQLRLDSLVGDDDFFLRAIANIPSFAGSDATVLISGETGTGKELFARAIHYSGHRRGEPFVPVNCGALPDHLFENELFGHVKGAFTDASSSEKGLIAFAEGGSLFLDEVDSLTPLAQVKLLRFLQDREYRPLGTAKNIGANVRILAATNSNLRSRVEQLAFRADLYHRLNILSLHVPPLRKRQDDIVLLATHFVDRFARQYARSPMRLSSSARRWLIEYSWPGNVRELENLIHRSVVVAKSPVLDAPNLELPSADIDHIADIHAVLSSPLRPAKEHAIDQFERTYLEDLLAQHSGNVSQAARMAGKERRSFQRLLRKHGINRQAFAKTA